MDQEVRNAALSPDRVQLLAWAARLGAVTADALARRRQMSIASASGRLHAAARRGELQRARPLTAEPAVFTMTRRGLRACGLDALSPVRITSGNAAHAIACARVAVALERAYPEHAVLGEPEVRAHERIGGAAPGDPALARALAALPLPHRPDLLLVVPGRPSGAVAVEVELTVKGPRRLERICREWARSHAVAGVLYLVAPGVGRAVLRAVRATGAGERVAVLQLADLDDTPCADPIPSRA